MNVFFANVKRLILTCIVLSGLQQFCYAELERFYGYWAESETYKRTIANPGDVHMNLLNMSSSMGMFRWNEQERKEEYYELEGNRCIVEKVEWMSDRDMVIKFVQPRNDFQFKPADMIIHVVADNIIKVLSGPYSNTSKTFYRLSNLLKKPVQTGVINAGGVRFRVRPDLQSDVLMLREGNFKVEVIGRSAEKEKIGDIEAYWYEVRHEYVIDGWVFGAYLELDGPDYFGD
jgi:hypothetical protein